MAWHALRGPQAGLGRDAADGAARCYRWEIAPFSAVERTDAEGWAALCELVEPGRVAILFRDEVGEAPAGWTELHREDTTQYIADDLAPPPQARIGEIVELGAGDVGDMLALTAATQPGPFSAETHRTGRYFGIRRDGHLVAMAGERMRVDGWGEVSAVCVDPSCRGEGLGAALTLAAARAIIDRGDRPMLHVRRGNDPAHRLYLELGFEVRRQVTVGVFRRTPAG
jgi:ribosomal protein S18 acetylase RimI-like enzyme